MLVGEACRPKSWKHKTYSRVAKATSHKFHHSSGAKMHITRKRTRVSEVPVVYSGAQLACKELKRMQLTFKVTKVAWLSPAGSLAPGLSRGGRYSSDTIYDVMLLWVIPGSLILLPLTRQEFPHRTIIHQLQGCPVLFFTSKTQLTEGRFRPRRQFLTCKNGRLIRKRMWIASVWTPLRLVQSILLYSGLHVHCARMQLVSGNRIGGGGEPSPLLCTHDNLW